MLRNCHDVARSCFPKHQRHSGRQRTRSKDWDLRRSHAFIPGWDRRLISHQRSPLNSWILLGCIISSFKAFVQDRSLCKVIFLVFHQWWWERGAEQYAERTLGFSGLDRFSRTTPPMNRNNPGFLESHYELQFSSYKAPKWAWRLTDLKWHFTQKSCIHDVVSHVVFKNSKSASVN